MSDVERTLTGEDTWRGRAGLADVLDVSSPLPGLHHGRPDTAGDTPIFHALAKSGWMARQHEPAAADRAAGRTTDPVTEFERDPLSAPIPDRGEVDPPVVVMRRAERMLRAPFTSGLPTLSVSAHPQAQAEPSAPARRGRHRQSMPNPPGGYRLHISPD